MTRPSAFPISICLLSAAFFFVLACSESLEPGEENAKPRTLTIVSPHNLDVKRELGQAFSDWWQGRTGETVVVDWLDQGGTSRCIRFTISQFERTPSGIGVDLFFGGGIDPYLRFGSLGLLQPCVLSEDALSGLPPSISGIPLRDPGGLWYGIAISTFGILMNDAVVKRCGLPSVETWTDLAMPEVYGWVAAADPRSGGVAHMIFEIILQALGWNDGWAVIMKLAGNSRYFTRFSAQIGKDVVAGEAAFGLVIDFYATGQMRQAQPGTVRFVVPNGLSVMNPDSIGMLRGAPEPGLARQFIAFLLTREGQRLWVLDPGEPGGPKADALDRLPVLPSIYAEPEFARKSVTSPYDVQGTIDYNHALGGQRWAILDDLIGATILDQHGLVQKAWRCLIDSELPPDKVKLFVRPPVSEAELLRLAGDEWNDPVRKSTVMTLWTGQTRNNLETILGSAGE
ncbi:MAG: extracellular solute-binding protein [bacterium]